MLARRVRSAPRCCRLSPSSLRPSSSPLAHLVCGCLLSGVGIGWECSIVCDCSSTLRTAVDSTRMHSGREQKRGTTQRATPRRGWKTGKQRGTLNACDSTAITAGLAAGASLVQGPAALNSCSSTASGPLQPIRRPRPSVDCRCSHERSQSTAKSHVSLLLFASLALL